MLNLTNPDKQALSSGVYQRLVATVTFADHRAIVIENKDIVQNNFSIDRYTSSASAVSIGTTIAAELNFRIYNRNGRYDAYDFTDAKISVVGYAGNSSSSFNLGTFYVYNAVRNGVYVDVLAYDSMLKMERPVGGATETALKNGSRAAADIISAMATDLGVTANIGAHISGRGGNANGLLNTDIIISVPSNTDTGRFTYRQLAAWIGEITGTCCFFDVSNRLCFDWFGSGASQYTISSSKYHEATIESIPSYMSGVDIYGDDARASAGSGDYTKIVISGNPFLASNNIRTINGTIHLSDVATRLNTYCAITMYKFTAVCMPLPFLELFDRVTARDINGNAYTTYITNWNYTLNGSMQLGADAYTNATEAQATVNTDTTSNDPYNIAIRGHANDNAYNYYRVGLDGIEFNPGGATSSAGYFKAVSVPATPYGIDFEVVSGTQNNLAGLKIFHDNGDNQGEIIGKVGVHDVGKVSTQSLSAWMTQIESLIYDHWEEEVSHQN